MAEVLSHPQLGEVRGKAGDSVVQFLGIKYASVKDLFAPSKLCDYSEGNGIDGTKLGPMALGPKAWDMEFVFIQKSLPMPEMTMCELEGLNLNITIPLMDGKHPGSEQKLPVFVFVHGGGFGLGSNAWPQYDQGKIVKLSAELGFPVIGVGINYRVGAPGFLTSEEMRAEGYEANNGLKDQINAFRWIHKFIGGFGGDPENVTFVGESAGSASGSLLLHSKEPLFQKYISMSGTSLMMKPLPPPVSEFAYASAMQAIGLEGLSGSERVKALIETSPEKLLALPQLPLLPVIDNSLIPDHLTFAQVSEKSDIAHLPGRKWCTDLFIGDCQFDGSILSFMLGEKTKHVAKGFCDSIEQTLAAIPHGAEKLRHAYKITAELEDSIALRNVLQFATDIGFFAPAVTFAQGWPGKAYLYHFNEGNPWEGEWKGDATHVLDIAYVFQNYNDELKSDQKKVAISFATDFIKFMNGKLDCKTFGEVQGALVYGPSADGKAVEYVEGIAAAASGRKNTIMKLGEELGLEELSAAWGNFLSGN